MTTWFRTEGSPVMHTIAGIGNTGVITRCRATLPGHDTIETHDDPPHEDRCEGCSRGLLDVMFIERGLRELAFAYETQAGEWV